MNRGTGRQGHVIYLVLDGVFCKEFVRWEPISKRGTVVC